MRQLQNRHKIVDLRLFFSRGRIELWINQFPVETTTDTSNKRRVQPPLGLHIPTLD